MDLPPWKPTQESKSRKEQCAIKNKIPNKEISCPTLIIRTKKKPTLKQTFSRLQGRTPLFRREYEALIKLLRESGREGELPFLSAKSIFLAVVGFTAGGAILKNTIAMPFAAALGLFIPIWSAKIYSIKYDRHISLQLESALALITSSYVRSSNIVAAITENLTYLDPLIRDVFEGFLAECNINANMETCILNMSRRIKHTVFTEWCTSLIKAYNNSALTEDLVAVASRLSAIRIIQDNLETETHEIIIQYILMLFLLVFTLPLIYLINYDWFLYFFTHPLGKFAVAYGLFALIYGISGIIRCSAPVGLS